ncbi:S-adenosyl-L-methionine-dependent methyltransferase family protein [Mycoavidus cysteinexigens]|uniref:S-adenosyl-L-methionine-dependent methyltransferase family protein n=2 Tax=Mycoavidus cysteinexigens TaxID=1553431 RepID=A0A2Z6ES60_9BURK|nr:S-adenosyl-L-methionine-dependent methyltransferase family protein [Mycoavidus cysteinexigens]GLR01973.1 SAM-dependent methyltransferase [Mycoavidus cysteinexigens]
MMKTNFYESASLPAPDDAARALSQMLRVQIDAALDQAGGWLPFNRYMELALYTPGLGYYSNSLSKFGRHAGDGSDFITAPELSPLFAQTLARAVAEALTASGTQQVMEFGAGSGALAAQLLPALDALGVRCERYTIVELSGALRAQQRSTLATLPDAATRVQWLDSLPATFDGVILGNEVLDAMPVRLFTRKSGIWFERGVTRHSTPGSPLEWRDQPLSPDANDHAKAQFAVIDSAGDYLTEQHEAAHAFTRTVCQMLQRGALLLIDYGFPNHEYYHPQRSTGTLMCHYRHYAHTDPFFYPGLQDITAHVEFSGIAQAALETGVDLLGYTSQARFLVNCGITELLAQFDANNPQEFLPMANAMQKLLSEAEMGELFKVIGFGRGMEQGLSGFSHGDRALTL